ncbi:MAG: PilZ domain-containing protein [Candidatus Omnitrophota bacterium]|nr:PilZ domain-containing protein [Candidatus Omnitrophota bacterium]
MQTEKRSNARFDLRDMDVLITGVSKDASAKGKNISARGMGLEIEDDSGIEAGKEERLTFNVVGPYGAVCNAEISGLVKWKIPGEKTSCFGIHICDLNSEAREFISRLTAEKEISEIRKLELGARNAEIRQHGGNALNITLGMITAAIMGLGLSLAQLKYMYLLPLLVIQMGFELYKLELKQIRRLGSYIRCFIEEEVKDLKWENHLYIFRSLSHAIQPYKDKDKFFTLGYYYTAVWLSMIALVLEFTNISFSQDRRSDFCYVSVYSIICLYWVFYRISRIREESRDYEGGERVDKDMFNLWRHVRDTEEGFCRCKGHFDELLEALWQRDIPPDFGRERMYNSRENKSADNGCFHRKNCPAFKVFNKIKERIQKGDNVPLHSNSFFQIKWVAALFTFGLITAILFVGRQDVMRYLESKPYLEPFIWFFAYFWLSPFLVLGAILRCAKVRIKRVYWAEKPFFNAGRVVKMDDVTHDLSDEEEELFPMDYVETKSVALFAWVFHYGWDKTWVREKGIWCVSFFGMTLFKREDIKDFISERWIAA